MNSHSRQAYLTYGRARRRTRRERQLGELRRAHDAALALVGRDAVVPDSLDGVELPLFVVEHADGTATAFSMHGLRCDAEEDRYGDDGRGGRALGFGADRPARRPVSAAGRLRALRRGRTLPLGHAARTSAACESCGARGGRRLDARDECRVCGLQVCGSCKDAESDTCARCLEERQFVRPVEHCLRRTCELTRSEPDQLGRTCGCSCAGCNPPLVRARAEPRRVVTRRCP